LLWSYNLVMNSIRVLIGNFVVIFYRLLVELKIRPFLYINITKFWNRGLYVDYDTIKELETKSDFTITFTNNEYDKTKTSLLNIAKFLSKRHKVFVYEYSPEAGGGAENDVLQLISSIPFRPALNFIGTVISEAVIAEIIHQAVEKWKINNKSEPKFVIRRVVDEMQVVYVFDSLSADIAIEASKTIHSVLGLELQKW